MAFEAVDAAEATVKSERGGVSFSISIYARLSSPGAVALVGTATLFSVAASGAGEAAGGVAFVSGTLPPQPIIHGVFDLLTVEIHESRTVTTRC